MKNNFFAKTNNIFINKLNAINLTALSIFLIYFLFIILLPIANGIISAGQDNLFVNRNNNINYYAQVLKLETKTNNSASTVDTTTYINNGQMLARQIDNNNLQSYVTDAKGLVLKLNSADKSQDQIYSYDAYGKPIAITKVTSALNVINSFQYNDERFDNNTNLQYLRARFYNPETKRFINQDTYDLLNKFNYVDANPVINIDPTGNNKFEYLKIAAYDKLWGNNSESLHITQSRMPVSIEDLIQYGKKLGQGSYGTAYKWNDLVFKIRHEKVINNSMLATISDPQENIENAKEVFTRIHKGYFAHLQTKVGKIKLTGYSHEVQYMPFIPDIENPNPYKDTNEMNILLNQFTYMMMDSNVRGNIGAIEGLLLPRDFDFVTTMFRGKQTSAANQCKHKIYTTYGTVETRVQHLKARTAGFFTKEDLLRNL